MTDFKVNGFRALRQMSRAIRRGDREAAFVWTMIAARQITLAERFCDLATQRHRRRPQPTPPPAPPPAAPAGPVMLDPKGFSPGGTPNWFLNQKRLERAGLK